MVHSHSSSVYHGDANDSQRHDRYRDSDDYELGESPRRAGYEDKRGTGRRSFRRRVGRRWAILGVVLLLGCLGTYRSFQGLPFREARGTSEREEVESVEEKVMELAQPTTPLYPAEVLGPPTTSFWGEFRTFSPEMYSSHYSVRRQSSQ